MEWLDRITITCFAASYLVVLALEISRAVFRANWWKWLTVSASLAGIFAHVTYLARQKEFVIAQDGVFISGWTGWFLAAALVLMVGYIWVLKRQGDSIAGLFIMPLVLFCIAIGSWPGEQNSFPVGETKSIWNAVHGLSLLFGTAVVGLGFLFGLMYLVQARRLKKNQVLTIRMPSLEWLQKSGERALWVSTVLLTIGLLSGIAINITNRIQGADIIAWTDPVIWTSAVLLAWLLIVVVFNLLYRPVRKGRKVSYLVVFCFLFLVLEIGIVWFSGHATEPSEPAQAHLLTGNNEGLDR